MFLLWLAFFFIAAAPGFWYPALTNILGTRGLDDWVTLAFLAGPVASLLSPVIGGALADNRYSAEKLLGAISIGGAWLIGMAFYSLAKGWNPWWFIGFLMANAIVSGPMWGLLSTIALTNLPNPERQFPLVRVGGTIGWIIAGMMVSYVLVADTSPRAVIGTLCARVLLGFVAFALPSTPPRGTGTGWRKLLGGDALKILRGRDSLVFFLTTGLVSVPLAAFYMYAPEHLRLLGDDRAAATMSIGQWSEILAMLVIGWLMTRCRVKTMLTWALALALLRYGLFTVGGMTGGRWWMLAGVSLQGLCYTFYFVTAQIFLNRRVAPELRAQAQGLLVLVNGGIGTLVGTLVVGELHRVFILDGGGNWTDFWAILAAMVVVSLVVFSVFYRGKANDASGT